MSNATTPAVDPKEFDEETRLMQAKLDELFEWHVNHGLAFLTIDALGVLIVWNINALKQTKILLTAYTSVGLFCLLMAKLSFRQGLKFKILTGLGVWMYSSIALTALTDSWPRFQSFVLAVTAFTVVLPAVFVLRFHHQTMEARKQKSKMRAQEETAA